MARARESLEILMKLRDSFTPTLGKATARLTDFARKVKGSFLEPITSRIFSLRTAIAGIAAVATTGLFASLIKSTADAGDVVDKLSKRLGISTEFIGEVGFAAEQQSIEFDKWSNAIDVATRRLGDLAATGTGEAKSALDVLGGGLTELVKQGATIEDIFPKLVEQFGKLESQTQKNAIAAKLFDASGKPLVALLDQTSEAIALARKESRALGLVWSGEDAEAAAAFGDAVSRLSSSLKGLLQSVVKPLLPELEKVVDLVREFFVEQRPVILDAIGRTLIGLSAILPRIEVSFQSILDKARDIAKAVALVPLTLIDLAVRAREARAALLDFDIDLAESLPDFLKTDAFKKAIEERKKEVEREFESFRLFVEQRDRLARIASGDIFDSRDLGKAGVDPDSILSRIGQQFVDAGSRARREIEDFRTELENALSPQSLPVDPFDSGTLLFDPEPVRELGRSYDETRAKQGGVIDATRAINFELLRLDEIVSGPSFLEEVFLGARDGVTQLLEEWNDVRANIRRGVVEIGDSIADNLSGTLTALAEQTKSTKDAFRDLARGILQDLQRILIRLLVVKALGAFGNLFKGPSQAIPDGFNTATSPAFNTPTGEDFFGSTVLPLGEGREKGGIVSRPGLYPLAERGRPEGVVPLENGAIPVTLNDNLLAGGGPQVNIYNRYEIQAIDVRSFDERFRDSLTRNKSVVGVAAAQEFQDNPSVQGMYR